MAAVIAGITTISLRAQDVHPAEAPVPRQRAVTLLVLQSGHVIEGRVSQSAGGYVVEKPNGRMLVPFRLVRFESANLAEAHKQMRKLYPDQNAQTKMSLAEWCLSQKMYAEAAGELRQALDLDMSNADARQMLDRVEALMSHREANVVNAPPKIERTADGFRTQSSESLAGLSPDAIREFTSRIQPTLLNKCGNAMCHGRAGATVEAADGNGFTLMHVRGGNGSRRTAMDKNLAQTLKYVNTANPKKSPLLTVPQGNHGMRGRNIFGGVNDDELLQTIQKWIERVAVDTGVKQPAKAGRHQTFAKSTDGKEEAGTLFVADKPGQTPLIHDSEVVPVAGEQTSDAGVSATSAEKLATPAHDAFDPAAFNRTAFGGSRPSH